MDPSEMVQREKQQLFKKIPDLSVDQKELLTGIYDELALSITELRKEAGETRDREAMRGKMMSLREEKNSLISDVLNSAQYSTYQEMTEQRRKQMEKRMQERENSNE
jgi:hypothetical protein